ncbi:MAG: TSUP family transporter, partial [Porticoccaceae bacterium]
GSIGYLFFPAWLGIVLASMPFARLGARVAHRLNERRLRQLFAGISLVLGVRFIWINSPLVLGS